MHKNDILLQKSGVDLRTVLNDRDFYVLNRRNRVWNCSALVKVFDLLFQVFPLGRLFLWLLHCICDKLAITTSHLFDTTAISLLQNASYIACRKIGNLNVKAQGIVNNKQTLTIIIVHKTNADYQQSGGQFATLWLYSAQRLFY